MNASPSDAPREGRGQGALVGGVARADDRIAFRVHGHDEGLGPFARVAREKLEYRPLDVVGRAVRHHYLEVALVEERDRQPTLPQDELADVPRALGKVLVLAQPFFMEARYRNDLPLPGEPARAGAKAEGRGARGEPSRAPLRQGQRSLCRPLRGRRG